MKTSSWSDDVELYFELGAFAITQCACSVTANHGSHRRHGVCRLRNAWLCVERCDTNAGSKNVEPLLILVGMSSQVHDELGIKCISGHSCDSNLGANEPQANLSEHECLLVESASLTALAIKY